MDDGEDVRSELSYAEPEVAPDASPIPIPSSAPPEEIPLPATPAPEVPAPVPSTSTPTFQQPVSHLTWHSEEHKKKFFELREEMHLQRTWQKPKNLAVLEALNEAMWKEELDYQKKSIHDYDEDLAAQWKDFSPRSEGFFGLEVEEEDDRMVEVEDIPDKAEEPHQVGGSCLPCFIKD